MIKKTVILLISAILILIAFSGCGGKDNSAIVGSWTPATAYINGQNVQYSELDIENERFSFVFDSNGKCDITLAGIKSNGTYSFNDTSVDVVTDSEEYKLDYDNGTLTLVLNYDNDITSFTFTKAREE